VNRYRLAGFRLEPASQRPPAWEGQRVRTLRVDHGEFNLGIKRRSSDGQPHAGILSLPGGPALIWLRCRSAKDVREA